MVWLNGENSDTFYNLDKAYTIVVQGLGSPVTHWALFAHFSGANDPSPRRLGGTWTTQAEAQAAADRLLRGEDPQDFA